MTHHPFCTVNYALSIAQRLLRPITHHGDSAMDLHDAFEQCDELMLGRNADDNFSTLANNLLSQERTHVHEPSTRIQVIQGAQANP